MVLVVFAVIPRDIRTGTVQPLAQPLVSQSVTYGPGWERIANPDGTVEMHQLPTFQRWDGAWRPMSSLNRSNGDWPYHLTDAASSFAVTRLNATLNQAKVPGATYEFQAGTIKETIAIPVAPPTPVISVALATTGLNVSIANTTIVLTVPSGPTMWTSGGFHAWDSSPVPRMWPNAISALAFANGVLNVTLNADMLGHARYPLYVDPTWTLSSIAGWGASTFQNATADLGDNTVKIGYFADNFNNNQATGWSLSGGVTFSGGTMNLANAGNAFHVAFWTYVNHQFDVNFASYQSGTDKLDYYVGCLSQICQTVHLEIAQSSSLVSLLSSSGGTLGQFSATINTGTWYTARIEILQLGSSTTYKVYWNAVQKLTIANQPAPTSGGIVFTVTTPSSVSIDNVRVWNTNSGTMTTAVRDAGVGYHATQTKTVGTVDAFNQMHAGISSSATNSNDWGSWTNLKADMASTVFYNLPDQDMQRYYKLRVTLTSGNEGTPALSELTTSENNQPWVVTPTSNTGFEPWYPYVGGLVNAVTGNVWYSMKDISIRARSFELVIQRSYNSLRGTEAGPIGNGWTLNYNEKLVLNPDTSVTWNDAGGSQQTFTPKGTTGGYAAPRGVPARLMKNGDGTYALWRLDGSRENFDSSGELTSIVDKNANKVTLTYTSGRLAKVADDSGQTLSLTYDGSNRIVSIRDPINRYFNYSYDGSSNLIQAKDRMGFLWNYTYSSGKLASIVDPVGKRTSFVYDGSSRATEIWLGFYQAGSIVWQFRQYAIVYGSSTRTITNARSYTTTITLNSFGNPTNHSGPSIGCAACDSQGNWTAYRWDGEMNKIKTTDGRVNARSQNFDYRSRLVSRTDPGGNVSTAAWIEVNTATQYIGFLMNETSFRGYKTSYSYDANGNLLTTTNALGNVAYRTYTSQGFFATSKDYRGYQTNFTYDTHGWLKQVQNPNGYMTTYDYDAVGRRLNVTTPLGFTTKVQYDGLDRPTSITDPLGNVTSYRYNARGDRTRVTDPNSYSTLYGINVTSRKILKTTEAGGNFTLSDYDLRGNLARYTNPGGNATTYEYDVSDRQTKETSAGGNSSSYTYDASGNMATRTDANGNLTKYGWDKENRLMTVTYPVAVVESATYDANGNTVHATGLGYTRDETWDALDRRTSTTYNYNGSFSKTVSYQYDVDSHRARMNYSDGTYVTYVWDPIGRLNKTAFSDGSAWWYEYDHDDRKTKLTEPNNVVTTWVYDAASRLNTTATKKGATTLESFTYWFDKAGNRVRIVEANGTWAKYNYDNLYRLVKESSSNGGYTSYDYDKDGDRRHAMNSTATTTYSYGKEDQLLQFAVQGGETMRYTYDKDGNVRSKTLSGSTTTYAYDLENRITSITFGGSTTSFGYSAEGKRMKRVSGGTTTYFGYDYAGVSGSDDLVAEFSSTGAVLTTYLHGPRVDEPLGMKQGTWSFYQRDGLGSVTRLTDNTGNTLATYRYNAFGSVQSQSGGSTTYGFTSRENEAALIYYRTRYYDPSAGRFTSADSAGLCGGYNRYAYVGNNPANRIDPSGRMPSHLFDGGGGGLIGGGVAQYRGSNAYFSVFIWESNTYLMDSSGIYWLCLNWDNGCYAGWYAQFVAVSFLTALWCGVQPEAGCLAFLLFEADTLLRTCVISSPHAPPSGGYCDCCRLWVGRPLPW